MPSSRGSSPPRDEIPELRSPTLQVDFLLLSEPSGKTKNTGVGSLSLLQGIFLTQESNLGWEGVVVLLHCRLILYHLSPQGSPMGVKMLFHGKPFLLERSTDEMNLGYSDSAI